jgi:hypothetical protein
MKCHQNIFTNGLWKEPLITVENVSLVLLFGNKSFLEDESIFLEISKSFPGAEIVGSSTTENIMDAKIYENSLCLTAIEFQSSYCKTLMGSLKNKSTFDVARDLAINIEKENLKYVMVLSDGYSTNDSKLTDGLKSVFPENMLVTGGIGGNGFGGLKSIVRHNDKIGDDSIILIGFYGNNIIVSHGCEGGWEAFGPDRTITSSHKNTIYTLDDKPALDIYKKYLGKNSDELPLSGLLFPIALKVDGNISIRTVLNIDDEKGSITFASDVPEGSVVQLMMSNPNSIVDGSEISAEDAFSRLDENINEGLIFIVSCIARKLVLKEYTSEELEVITDTFGHNFNYAGFYSYGEICPRHENEHSSLHNQTMTITTICESHE